MSQITLKVHEQNLTKIEKNFSKKIHSWEYFEDGFDNHAYEINKHWIFKIPRRPSVWDMLKREKGFLDVFCHVSPINVPQFEFFSNHLVGYKKITGTKLSSALFDSLNNEQKKTLAQNLGTFLSTLHSMDYPIESISDFRDFFYPSGFEKLVQKIHKIVLPRMAKKTQKNILNYLSEVQNNEENFNHPRGLAHSDLYDSHMYWDEEKNRLNGVIDFGEVSKNALTMDFTLLADFCDPKNDPFLKELLSVYHSNHSDLFRKIKVFSMIEKLYWPIEVFEASKTMPAKFSDFELSLEAARKVFT